MVSLLNGLGGFGTGLGAFAGKAIQDEADKADATARQPLINATPAAPVESTPAAAPDAPVQTAVAGVPAELLPIYAAAAKRTGIPVDVLIAQAKQESDFNVNAVGKAGEIGLHQILPSTARDPGGMPGVDPTTLRDPAANIAFAASYLKTRAPDGADFNDPAVVNAALHRFNGGGDANYVANVRRYMGST